jgi:hypothetical protein
VLQVPQVKFNEVKIAPSRWRRLEVVRENIDLDNESELWQVKFSSRKTDILPNYPVVSEPVDLLEMSSILTILGVLSE